MGLELNLSDRCNLRCPFCYTRGSGGRGPDWNRTEKALRWYFDENKHVERSITVFGGEPLVEWDELIRLLDWRDARQKADGKRLSVGIVTNMTLLTKERFDVLRKRHVRVSPSIDGNAAAQDACRVFPNGAGSSGAVFENARRLVKARPHQSVRATYSPATVQHLADSVRFLHEDLGFWMVNAVQAGGADWTPESLGVLDEQLARLTDWYVERMREDPKRKLDLYHIRNVARILRLAEQGKRANVCKVGRGRVAIDTAGNIWPCHRFANPNSDLAWRIGTVEAGITNPDLVRMIRQFNPARGIMSSANCRACPLKSMCYALCWWEVMAEGKHRVVKNRLQIRPAPSWCHAWRGYYREAKRALDILRADGIDPYPVGNDCRTCSGVCQKERKAA